MTEVNFLEMAKISDISMYKRDPWKFHPRILQVLERSGLEIALAPKGCKCNCIL